MWCVFGAVYVYRMVAKDGVLLSLKKRAGIEFIHRLDRVFAASLFGVLQNGRNGGKSTDTRESSSIICTVCCMYVRGMCENVTGVEAPTSGLGRRWDFLRLAAAWCMEPVFRAMTSTWDWVFGAGRGQWIDVRPGGGQVK